MPKLIPVSEHNRRNEMFKKGFHWCTKCCQFLELENFLKINGRTKYGYKTWCRDCTNKLEREWRKNNKNEEDNPMWHLLNSGYKLTEDPNLNISLFPNFPPTRIFSLAFIEECVKEKKFPEILCGGGIYVFFSQMGEDIKIGKIGRTKHIGKGANLYLRLSSYFGIMPVSSMRKV